MAATDKIVTTESAHFSTAEHSIQSRASDIEWGISVGQVFYVEGDTFKIDRAFCTSGNGIFLNNKLVFEGELQPDEQVTFSAENREYRLKSHPVPGKVSSFRVSIFENGALLSEVVLDQNQKEAPANANRRTEEHSSGVKTCGAIFAALGVATMIALSITTRAVPGGALGGAIGAAVGYAVGIGIGKAFSADH
ncbi:MAG: hypothetical protein MPJ50_15225 [Pirellulales bacterium]|nr:hypothetical protein [Pirellulales bacterium]